MRTGGRLKADRVEPHFFDRPVIGSCVSDIYGYRVDFIICFRLSLVQLIKKTQFEILLDACFMDYISSALFRW
jgi:hypothetical protein